MLRTTEATDTAGILSNGEAEPLSQTVGYTAHAFRRTLMGVLGLGTLACVLYFAGRVFSDDGLDLLELIILSCIALSAPWTILGFWNSIIGLALALVSKNPTKLVAPFLSDVDDDAPIRSRVAVAMAVRNEDAERVFARLIAVRQSLDLTGYGAQFDLHILSDTDNSEIAEQEEALFKSHRVALNGLGAARYRRRTDNAGFKAGNVWQFLEDHADGYEMFVPLDADSLMSGGAILKLVRIAEANPRLGIVQSLAVGAPAESAFGRMFQFGMRHGMRAFTLGSAWWQGDCGPFWGHNAVVRCQAFHRNCKLPKLGGRPPLGGEILSHDQLEAVMMRRAGYEVRVVPVESESFEENPVTVLDFIQREQRWCNGNMQYLRLLGMRGLERTSRFQLVQAIMMYLSAPAWMLLTALGIMKIVIDPYGMFDLDIALAVFLVMFTMSMTPKMVGALHVALQPGGVARYGGTRSFMTGMGIETLFSMLMAPVVALHLTIFLVGLFLGRKIGWNGQIRDAYGMEWRTAAKAFWPQTLMGLVLLGILAVQAPYAVAWSLPVLTGLIIAIPMAVLTASPRLGRWLAERRLCATPEEFEPAGILELMEPPQSREPVAA